LGATIDFPVAAPPKLTYAGYVAFLESIPTHPSWLYFASCRGDVEAVRQMLRDNPDLDGKESEQGFKYLALRLCVVASE